MTAEQIKNWMKERDIARAISDSAEREKALEAVYDHKDDMMLECIQHQADRVKIGLANDALLDAEIKGLKGAVNGLRDELKPLKESDKDYRQWKLKIQGGILLWKILKYLVAGGCGAALLRLLQSNA